MDDGPHRGITKGNTKDVSPKIHSSFWNDDDVGVLTPEHKLAFVWLITNERTNNVGFCIVQKRQFVHDTGLNFDSVQGLLKAHARAFVWDEENGQLRVWIRSFIQHQWAAGELKPTSRLFPNLQRLAEALPPSFQKALASSYPALCKPLADGKALARGQHSTEQHSTEQKKGGPGENDRQDGPAKSAEIPTEEEFLSYAKAYPGSIPRSIPPGMPEAWAMKLWNWRTSETAPPFPVDWKKDMVQRFEADWVEGRKNTRHATDKKTAPKKASDIDAMVEIDSLKAELQWQDKPERRQEIKSRLNELEGGE